MYTEYRLGNGSMINTRKILLSISILFALTACGGGQSSSSPSVPSTVLADADSDGVSDNSDTCPDTQTGTTVDSSGCPMSLDSDDDGVIDSADTCPNTPPGTTVDSVGCSVPVDGDNDGVVDSADTCPSTPPGTTVDSVGCSVPVDTDNDGVVDSADTCPNTPPGTTVDSVGCSVPVDTDNDGVVDSADTCPSTPPGTTVDSVGCSVPVDTDNDGVVDSADTCPNTPAGATVDSDGCPVPVAQEKIEVSANNGKLIGGRDSEFSGFSLYVFDNDLNVASQSTCNDSCAQNWPPVLVNDSQPSGVNDLGIIIRQDGSKQISYKQRPLYFYAGDSQAGQFSGDSIANWHSVDYLGTAAISVLFDDNTALEPLASFVREDGVVVTRVGDRGRDRHAKDITVQDHYDHYLAHYWEYRTVRIQLEDFVPNGESLIRATFITESELGAREFRVWFWGRNTTGQFHFNPQKDEEKVSQLESGVKYLGTGTWNNDFEKTSDVGHQYMYQLDIVNQWQNGGQFQPALQVGKNMEFEVSLFLLAPPAGSRLNYYGTSFVYVVGEPGLAPFEWQRGVDNVGGSNDGTPIAAAGLLGGDTTLGYNYSEEPAGRFIQMATNLSPGNAQQFVQGRRVHHTNFDDGSHDERSGNPVWTQQIGKAGEHYINHSCAACHVRNGRALVADVGESLDKWVFKIGDELGEPDPLRGRILQPNQEGNSTPEGSVTLGPWTELSNGLRQPNYIFSQQRPARFSARIAPQLVGLGLLEAIPESTLLEWQDENDADSDGISGRASVVNDLNTGEARLGRFGYKAATYSVEHQVASALNTDIGVMTDLLPAPDCGAQQVGCGDTGSELDQQYVDELVKYNSLLGVGARRNYEENEGIGVFNSIGCASCHRQTMTTSAFHPLAELRNQIIQPFTDLLLHDLGVGLADDLGEGSATGAEWRTAPLWGLGHTVNVLVGDDKANDQISLAQSNDDIDRVGYLHDGRARNIEEAILWHGGEAQASKEAFEVLPSAQKTQLLEFLNSL
ncbi:MAG: CxxC motif-containing protein (DUF1111 family)/predicted lipoprotein with Yx(FWY)xxD motif [Paraglaciecola sp.]|jgi:CxxC motif-containing protein (DUF1111 family)/predicted lipoprotein with Yx(FWY)xxD motif